MNHFSKKYALIGVVVCILLIFMAACSGKDNESKLRKRVTKYWSYIIDKNGKKVYEMEYSILRKQVEPRIYERKFKKLVVLYEHPEIKSISIDKDGRTAVVKVGVTVGVRPPGSKKIFKRPVVLTEKWVLEKDGKWYHVPKNVF